MRGAVQADRAIIGPRSLAAGVAPGNDQDDVLLTEELLQIDGPALDVDKGQAADVAALERRIRSGTVDEGQRGGIELVERLGFELLVDRVAGPGQGRQTDRALTA